jgi:hypothetical protein
MAHDSAHATRSPGLRVRSDGRPDPGLSEARNRFGGLDLPATLVGMLAALALLILIGGLIGAAIGAIGYQAGLDGNHTSLSAAGLAGGIAALFIAFLIGGWTAGRIARYDGVKNGLMTAVWAIVLAAILSGLGAWLGSKYNVFANAPNLPNWFSRDAVTIGAIASAVGAAIAMLVGGALGGRWGERYHRRIDSMIASTRSGGIATGERRIVEPR